MKFNFRKILQRETLFSAFKKQDLFLNQSREWIRGLILAAGIFIAGIVFIAFDFYTQFYVSPESIEVPAQEVIYREKDVRAYADKFDAKERSFNALRVNRQPVVAPLPVGIPVSEATTTLETVSDPSLADVELGQ
ncbi:MAG: hypothetical protein WAW13_04250 [Minisyncoccia bacterium]